MTTSPSPIQHQYLDPAAILRRLSVQPGMQVGDFGAGGGAYFALEAATIVGDKGIVWAIDVFKPALSACASKAKLAGLTNVKTVWSNLEIYRGARNIPDHTLDIGFLVSVLHLSKKHREILRECSRMLKPGASFLVIDWEVTGFGFGPKREDLVPQQYIEKIALDLGLKVSERLEASRYHYGLIFTVPARAGQK